MIDKKYCEKCRFWKLLCSQRVSGYACHYSLSGKSPGRVKTGQTEVCNVREPRTSPIRWRIGEKSIVQKENTPKAPRNKAKHTGGRPLSFDKNKAIELINQGLNDDQISSVLGINRGTFKAWRNRSGIKGNRKTTWKPRKRCIKE